MPIAVLTGWFLGTRTLIFLEKQFLYCLANTKEIVHPVESGRKKK